MGENLYMDLVPQYIAAFYLYTFSLISQENDERQDRNFYMHFSLFLTKKTCQNPSSEEKRPAKNLWLIGLNYYDPSGSNLFLHFMTIEEPFIEKGFLVMMSGSTSSLSSHFFIKNAGRF